MLPLFISIASSPSKGRPRGDHPYRLSFSPAPFLGYHGCTADGGVVVALGLFGREFGLQGRRVTFVPGHWIATLVVG
jgi:hypothetical protein